MIPREDALLAVCKALNPFFSFDLLQANGQQPVPEVEKVRIADALILLNAQDKKFGLHVIDFILTTIVDECRAAGFTITLGKGVLALGKIKTIGALVTRIRNQSEPVVP